MNKGNNYDVLIIGAGVGGLVCACYLAKAGLKTLLIEKNRQVGGYCSSFTRKGYHFDSCVHAVSSLRKGAVLQKLLDNLELNDRIAFVRHNPPDVVVTPHHQLNIYVEIEKAIAEFQHYFPQEKIALRKFFEHIVTAPLTSLFRLRGMTFEQLLDSHFSSNALKTILGLIVAGLVGVFPDRLSALVACLIYREFIFDGGYYPSGGMQNFPDVLLNKYIELGGEAILGKTVNKIVVNGGKAERVVLDDGESIYPKYVVSGCDARHTFLNLVGESYFKESTVEKLKNLTPSLSAFMTYLGLDNDRMVASLTANTWVMNNLDMHSVKQRLVEGKIDFIAITSAYAKNNHKNPEKPTVTLSTLTDFKQTHFWGADVRRDFAGQMKTVAQSFLPDLIANIKLEVTATPITLQKWTGNYLGAAYGWESTPHQFCDPDISQHTSIPNLFLTGHWTNLSSGITSVINCGFDTADMILHYAHKVR